MLFYVSVCQLFVLTIDLLHTQSMDLQLERGGGGDIDMYVVHYVLSRTGFSYIRAVDFLVHFSPSRVYTL